MKAGNQKSEPDGFVFQHFLENHFEADASLHIAQADGYQKSDVRNSESRTCTPSAKLTK